MAYSGAKGFLMRSLVSGWRPALVLALLVALGPSLSLAETCSDRQARLSYGASGDNPALGFALLLGNSAYGTQLRGELVTPINDVEELCHTLTDRRYRVVTATNLSRDAMIKLINKLPSYIDNLHFVTPESTTPTGEARQIEHRLVLIYYAGHGIQFFGENYLVPIDTGKIEPAQERIDLEETLLPLSYLLTRLQASLNLNRGGVVNRLTYQRRPGSDEAAFEIANRQFRRDLALVILDACRSDASLVIDRSQINNQFSQKTGLAKVVGLSDDVGLIFAASYDQLASNVDETATDPSPNSPFAKALVAELGKPQVSVALAYERIRQAVLHATVGEQEPAAQLANYWKDHTLVLPFNEEEREYGYDLAICSLSESDAIDSEGVEYRLNSLCLAKALLFKNTDVRACGLDCRQMMRGDQLPLLEAALLTEPSPAREPWGVLLMLPPDDLVEQFMAEVEQRGLDMPEEIAAGLSPGPEGATEQTAQQGED